MSLHRYVLSTLVALTLHAAFAYPTFSGPTGYGTLSTADVVGANHVQIAADFTGAGQTYPVDFDYDGSTVTKPNPHSALPFRVLYGPTSRTEVGVTYIANSLGDELGVNAKYQIRTRSNIRIAYGLQFFKTQGVDSSMTRHSLSVTAPVVTRKGAIPAVDFSLLLGGGDGSWTNPHPESELTIPYVPWESGDDAQLGAGLEVRFANGASLAADTVGQIHGPNLSAIEVRYPVSQAMTAQVGWENGTLFAAETHRLNAGLSYTFTTR